jgi:hypothetical protein
MASVMLACSASVTASAPRARTVGWWYSLAQPNKASTNAGKIGSPRMPAISR